MVYKLICACNIAWREVAVQSFTLTSTFEVQICHWNIYLSKKKNQNEQYSNNQWQRIHENYMKENKKKRNINRLFVTEIFLLIMIKILKAVKLLNPEKFSFVFQNRTSYCHFRIFRQQKDIKEQNQPLPWCFHGETTSTASLICIKESTMVQNCIPSYMIVIYSI